MAAIEQLSPPISTREACRSLAVSRASLYRRRRQGDSAAVLVSATAGSEGQAHPLCPLYGHVPVTPLSACETTGSARALSPGERVAVLSVLHDERFLDQSPAEVYATLLDEGSYLCSLRTMYRLLTAHSEVRERRNQLRHPSYKKPELVATGPNQVWSWDITKLLGPAQWSYYYLYVILDIFSATSSAG